MSQDLPKLMLALGNHKQGMLDDLLKPILDERASLNIVFQVMRMTALIVIVLTFIFIVVVGFQMLPLASGATTASDQLRSLISLRAVAAGGEVAKVAIIGVTAVGIGTAVVVGGRALEGGSAIVKESYLPGDSRGKGTSRNPPATGTPVEHPIVFTPNINVPKPLVLDQRTIVAGDNAKLISQLEVLIKALPNAQVVAELDGRVRVLETKPPPNTPNYVDALGAIKNSIDRITSLPGPCPCPKLPTDNDSLKIDFQPLLTVINRMESELKKSNEEERPRRGPDDRNAWARTKDFIRGADYFAVSLQSLDNFTKALIPTVLDPKLEQALKDMMTLPPQRKSEFLSTLRLRVERTPDSVLALAQLKEYERKILYYFKLSN